MFRMADFVGLMLLVLMGVCCFYWAVAALISVFYVVHRSTGYSHSSGVYFVGTITGLIAAAILREWFGWITSPLVYGVVIAPDVLHAAGDLALWFRIRVLGWPDKFNRRAYRQQDSMQAGGGVE